MKSATKSAPAYLVRTPYSYCFRYIVPADLREVVGKVEIRYSLKTGYLGKAKALAGELAGKVRRLFVDIRGIIGNERGCITVGKGKVVSGKDLTPELIQELVAGWVRETLKEEEDTRINPVKPVTEDYLDDRYEAFDYVQTLHKEDLGLSRHAESMAHRVDILLQENGIIIDKASDPYLKLCREMLKASIKVLEVEKQRTFADYSSGTDEEVVASIVPSQAVQPQQPASLSPPLAASDQPLSISLQDLISEYQDERVKAGRWKEGTIRTYQPFFAAMTQALGADTIVNTITRQQMVDYKRLLSALPPGFARLNEYCDISGLTIQDVQGKHHDKQMDITTLRSYIQMAESVFAFGVRNGYLDKNPAEGLKPPKKKQAREQRQAFDDDDLHNMFHGETYTNDLHKQPYQFWLPILGLYTGCRLEELCQLYIEDVKEVEGLWCLDINSDKDKSLKNESSDRMVPLHPLLVDTLDFPGFVESAKAKGQERIFHELKKQSGDYGHYASRWFARFKEKAGIDMTPNKKVFHSFRHNFTDTLFKNMVMETIIEELTGRAGKTETTRRYAKGYNIKDLHAVIAEKLNYPLDLSHLKASRWVVVKGVASCKG